MKKTEIFAYMTDQMNPSSHHTFNATTFEAAPPAEVETDFSSAMLTFAAIMTFIIMIVGISGNFLTIVALVKCPKVRNVAAAFIISLCLADLIFCILVLPFSGLRFVQGTWTHGKILCKIIPFFQYGNIGVSLLCIAMITINRYVMIAHHSLYSKIYKRYWIAIMIAFCWLFSYGMQLPTLFAVWGTFDFDPKLGTCSIMTDDHGRSSKTTLFITAFIIPCIIIIACYAKIFWVVHESENRLKNHANNQNSIPNNLRPVLKPTNSNDNGQQITPNFGSESSFSTEARADVIPKQSRVKDQREVHAKRNEWRITKMVLAIFLSFVICYLPITIVKVADKDVEHPNLHIMSYIMLYLSACINPIIYGIMNKQYRKAYKTVILCKPSKLLNFGKNGAGGSRGSSAAENWKDTELSNNHSRTMVSQVSALEHQNSSLTNSQPEVSSMEMSTEMPTLLSMVDQTNRSNLTNQLKITLAKRKEVQQMRQETQFKPKKMSKLSPKSSKESNQITLVGGDIIMEEEEEEGEDVGMKEEENMEETENRVMNLKDLKRTKAIEVEVEADAEVETAVAHHMVDSSSINHKEIQQTLKAPTKKTQFYGQAVNVTPDNSNAVQLFTVLKM